MRHPIPAALGFLLIVSSSALAQTRETINVHVVEVPVTVVASDGTPVRGLTAKNFEVYDGKEKRTITGFDTIDFASKEPVNALTPVNPAARRNFLLLFDRTFSSPKGLERAQAAAREFVSKELQPRDFAAVGTIEAEKGFSLLTAFTTDRDLLLEAIGNPLNVRLDDPLRLAASTPNAETVRNLDPTNVDGGGGQVRKGASNVVGEFTDLTGHARQHDDQFVRGRIEREINALGQLAETLRAVRGRKQIVLLSEGFEARLIIGRDPQDTNADAQENVAVSRGDISALDVESRYGAHGSIVLLEQMAQFFRGSDVVLNALDIQGLRVQNDVRQGAVINTSNALSVLTRPTGGMVFKQSNSLTGDFERLMKAQEVVYVLAFQAPSTGSGKFHDLKVKLVDVPGRPQVFARAGYYEVGSQNATERTLSNAEVVMNDLAQGDVPMTAWAASYPTSTDLAIVPVILEIDGPALLKGAKGSSAFAQVYIYAFDQDGLVRDRLYQKVGLDLGKVGDRLKSGGMKYYGTLVLPPGTYAVKSLVRAADSDLRGFARVDLVVPKSQQLALDRPVFIEEGKPSWVMVKGTSHDMTNAYPFALGTDTFVPTTRASADSRKFTVLVWNAKPDELTWQTKPAAKFLGQLQSGNVTKLVFQLDRVDPSAATLDVTVQKKGTPDAMKTTIPIIR